MKDLLVTRKFVLESLGFSDHMPRWAWSHDLGDSIAFDAWEDVWEPQDGKALGKYPLRTNGPHYNLERSRAEPRLGHTRWQQHVDLVIAGKRQVRAFIPVRDGSKGGRARWRAMVIEGRFEVDDFGQIWLITDHVVQIR